MNRPTGVTILAILCFIGAVFCLLGGILFLLGGGFLASVLHQQGGGILAGLGALAGVAIIIIGGIYLLVGMGLWKLKEWARIVTIVLTAIGAVLNLPGLLASLTHLNVIALVWTVFWLAIDVWIIMYLMKPHVKAAFQGAQARAVSA